MFEKEAEEYGLHQALWCTSGDLKDAFRDGAEFGYNKGKENARLESQVEQLQKINSEQKEMLKKVRIALIQERTANIMKYGKDGVEMFDSILRRVKENEKV